MDARTVPAPSWASLAGQAGAEGAHPRSRSTLDVPSGSGPEVRWGRPPLSLLGDCCGLICGLWFVGMKETQ